MNIEDVKKQLTKDGVIIRYDDKGRAFVSMPVGKIPLKQFQEWQTRCDAEFLGNRWDCIWTDYLRQKSFDAATEAEIIRRQYEEEQKNEKEVPAKLGTLGGE